MSKLLQPKHEEREKYDEDSYEEMLNEAYGTVSICGYDYNAGYALKELDSTAFRCGFADMQEYEDIYICPICSKEHDDEDDALYCCQDLFECPVCGDEYEDSDEAEACCKDEDDDEDGMQNIVGKIEKLYQEAMKNSDTSAAGYDEGFYNGEANAYAEVLGLLLTE